MGTTQTVVSELSTEFAGRILTESDAEYDSARTIFNAMIDRRPAVIAQCANADDVANAIRVARAADMEISVRGGGHGVAGTSIVEGGLVIDMRLMNSATVHTATSTVTIGGGGTISDLDRAGEPFGLATTGGRASTTGIGGFTFGGGSGWIERAFGLACDNLVSVDLVTASGEKVRASVNENPELFWALHGGGGNFGVVTSLTLRLHPVHTSTIALLLWDPSSGPAVGRAYREFINAAPNEVGGGFAFVTAPDAEFVPAGMRDRLACAVIVTFLGTEAEAREAIAPILKLDPAGHMIAEMPYADMNCLLDDPPGFRNYWSAEYLNELPDAAIDRFCSRAQDMVSPSPSQFILLRMGGAVASGPSEYPVPWRTAPWVVHPFGLWSDPADDDRMRQFARDARADVAEWSTGAVYLNFIGNEGRERTIAGFGADNYERLVAVKDQYDPDNVFHRNHNIEPSGLAG